jgi:hypothetical protein
MVRPLSAVRAEQVDSVVEAEALVFKARQQGAAETAALLSIGKADLKMFKYK